ncbi:MAG: hypothetical protein M1814_000582 [Vezdaea aestivalis]|nr:MAG: hypothetical protein M1814_000582 [Vezdaea aestivalis]
MHVPPRRRRGLTNDSLSANPPTRQTSTNAPAPDRNTSVRSVITLPAYKPSPSESEQTLGREGERGGIDVVVSFPESAAEIEDRRNTEMESLYQIRATRRAEGLAREDRRERRRVARAAGDNDALEQIRRERDAARAASSGPGDSTSSLAAQVLAENAQRERERRISSVSYASIGLAIHDGSRVRASSTESERPLLGVEDGGRPNPSFLGGHTRGRSGSSALSVSTLASAEHSPSPVRGRGDSRVTLETINLGGRDRAGSAGTYGTTQDGESGDVADVGFPTEAPPGYEGASWNGRPAPGDGEEAPPYESPVRARAPPLPLVSPNGAPQLPALGRLPEIEITTHEQVGSR